MQTYIRPFAYGFAFISTLLIGTSFHLSFIKGSQPQSVLPSFFCTNAGIHTNCFFSRSLCYNLTSNDWETSADLPDNWTGVSLRSRGSLFRDNPSDSACNAPFIPQRHPFPSGNHIAWINGTNVLSCIWVNVFGHIFLEMMLPAWMSMRNIADRLNISAENITYILDNRRGSPMAPASFSLLSSQPILSLADLANSARAANVSHLCFERLIVGYRLQSSLEYAHNVAHLQVGDLARYRDAIKRLHNVPLKVNMAPGVCVALLLRRRHSRHMSAKSEQEVTKTLRDRTLCTVQVATFEDIDIVEQMRLVANSSIFVHASGSGSHHFIWLPDGGASLTIVHPYLELKVTGNGAIGGGGVMLNDFLCWKHPTILCVNAAAQADHPSHLSNFEVDMYSFSNALDMIKLWQNNRGNFDPRDPSE